TELETGLATVPDVTRLEIRRREGQVAWRAVDFGDVRFTDRRMVFCGSKNVEFRYAELTTAGLRSEGLYVAVSTRKRDHILAGPSERLAVLLDACRASSEGQDPAAMALAETNRASGLLASTTERLAALRRERDGLTRPGRPISPAWLPGLAAALLLFALGAYADGNATTSSSAPPSNPVQSTPSPAGPTTSTTTTSTTSTTTST